MPDQPERRFDYRRAITELREQRRMSREALAEAAGISASYLYEVERGLKRPSTDVLAKLAAALGMLPSQVLEYMERQMAPPAAGRPNVYAIAAPASRREWAAALVRAEPEGPTESSSTSLTPSPNPTLGTLMSVAQDLDEEDLNVLLQLARRLREKKS